jgi:hypothetical protein
MSVCLVVSIPGATLEQYDDVRRGLGTPLGDGQISHVAGATADGVCVVDVWDSRADFDRFMQGELGAEIGRVGLPEPQIVEFEVHVSEQRA